MGKVLFHEAMADDNDKAATVGNITMWNNLDGNPSPTMEDSITNTVLLESILDEYSSNKDSDNKRTVMNYVEAIKLQQAHCLQSLVSMSMVEIDLRFGNQYSFVLEGPQPVGVTMKALEQDCCKDE